MQFDSGMENIGSFRSIKICFGSVMFFGFKHYGSLCRHIVLGRKYLCISQSMAYFTSDYVNCSEYKDILQE